MKSDDITLTKAFSSILSLEGISDPIERLEIKGLQDQPGFHWSNPGVKLVSVSAGGKCFSFVLKRLHENSKREVLVYRFLSGQEVFPIPRLFYDVYDEDRKEYWIVIEQCSEHQFPKPEDFWKQIGLLLARIHATYWDKAHTLPGFFHVDGVLIDYIDPTVKRQSRMKTGRLQKAMDMLTGFLESLEAQEAAILKEDLGLPVSNLLSSLASVEREHLPLTPEINRCLTHGAFHPPEIVWREVADELIPVGVDWERSRAGVPGEDLRTSVNNLLAKGKEDLFATLMDTYLSEMDRHGISASREKVEASARYENMVHTMRAEIPFISRTYLNVHNNDEFTEWCRWVRQNLPDQLRFLQEEIRSYQIQTKW